MRKWENLADTLRKRSATLASGTRLPSVRSLMQRYEVSLQTVTTALKELEREGLIDRRRGSGVYTTDKKTTRLIEFHAPLFMQGSLDAREYALGLAIAEAGWSMRARYHHPTLDDPSDFPDPGASAHVVLSEFTERQRTFFGLVERQQVPIVIMGRHTRPSLDMVATQDHPSFGLLVRHLLSLGHSRIGFILNEPSTVDTIRRRQVFSEVMGTFGLDPSLVIDCGTQRGEMSSIRARETVTRYLKELRGAPLPFTALLTQSAAGAFGAIRAMADLGLRVPADCSVVTLGREPDSTLYIPALTDAGVERLDIGRAVVSILSRRFAGETGEPIRLEIMPTIQVRESTGPAPVLAGG